MVKAYEQTPVSHKEAGVFNCLRIAASCCHCEERSDAAVHGGACTLIRPGFGSPERRPYQSALSNDTAQRSRAMRDL